MLKPISRATLADYYDRGAIRVVHYLLCRFDITLAEREARMFQQWRGWFNAIRRIFTALLILEEIMGQVADALAGVKEQLAKAKAEILGKIADLEAQLAAAGLDPADIAAVEELKGVAQDFDNIVPDAASEPDAPAPTAPVDPEF